MSMSLGYRLKSTFRFVPLQIQSRAKSVVLQSVRRHSARRTFYAGSNTMDPGDSAASAVNVVFFLGAAGSGKSTVCENIVGRNHRYAHLSAGALLRKERGNTDSPFHTILTDFMKVPGRIIPSEITTAILEKEMETRQKAGISNFLIDAFPINEENLCAWNDSMSEKAVVRCVIFIDIPEELSVKRCLGRQEGRADDLESTIRIRFVEFERQTLPVVKHYQGLGILKTINGMQEKQEILEESMKLLAHPC